ncbi:MAG: putative colanic acid biosynthesis acetyltransferase, partial [Bacteroidetes bacterium]|nr:putative colanic acid biosynthesis acetyltransferase [Bacteroidota bacterium]
MSEVNFKYPFSKGNKLKRMLWSIIWSLFAKPFPRKMLRRWNIILLRTFGAKVHSSCVVYSSAKISMPWNLVMEEHSCIASDTIIENAATVTLGAYSIVSQYSYLCTATHDIRYKDFPQYSKPIALGRRSWVTARCFIGPGVTIGEGAVVGASSSVFKDVMPWTVVGGN